MEYIVDNGFVVLQNVEDFRPELIFDCGQAFRWIEQADGEWIGVAMGKVLGVRADGDKIYLDCPERDYPDIWYDYFDMGRDYARVRAELSSDDFASLAAEFGKGIRVLRQDPWEALCTFIISQCNNIKRIRGIVERMCELFGDSVTYRGKEYYLFPTPERIAGLSPADMEPMRAGYRAGYLLNAALEVVAGNIKLHELEKLSYDEVMDELMRLKGVGKKVANCVALFGCRKVEAFPVDVWIKRALDRYYGGKGFDVTSFGDEAGIVQQYIFHYIRNGLEG